LGLVATIGKCSRGLTDISSWHPTS
jgi:hypothetical protein